jgi:hypothetical protein
MTDKHDRDKPAPEQAPANNTPSVATPWLARVKSRVKKIVDTVDDRCAQLRHGSHSDHRRAIIARLKELPGGEAMLLSAKKHGVKISVVSLRRNKGSKGKFTRSSSGARIRVSNTGSGARMATTLWHELRHMQQHIERGDMTGGVTRVLDTRAQHMISLMIEADAYTAQMLMGLRQKKAGNPEYYDALMERKSPAFISIKKFLKKTPYETVQDEKAFARALFTEMMLTGLPAYHAKYLDAYAKAFESAKTAEEFRAQMSGRKPPPDFAPSKSLHDIYGVTAPPDLRRIAASFLSAQDKALRRVIGKVDDTTRNAAMISETDFQQAKAEIVRESKRLAKSFRKNAAPTSPQKHDILRTAAIKPF